MMNRFLLGLRAAAVRPAIEDMSTVVFHDRFTTATATLSFVGNMGEELECVRVWGFCARCVLMICRFVGTRMRIRRGKKKGRCGRARRSRMWTQMKTCRSLEYTRYDQMT